MADGTRGAASLSQTSVTDPYEPIYRAKILGVTSEELPDLVRKPDTSVAKVPRFSGKRPTK